MSHLFTPTSSSPSSSSPSLPPGSGGGTSSSTVVRSSSARCSPMDWVVQELVSLVPDSHPTEGLKELSPAIAAVKVLTEVIRRTSAGTLMGLQQELMEASNLLKNASDSVSVASACELFARFVTRTSFDVPDFDQCKMILIERGDRFTEGSENSRQQIAQLADPFIQDGMTIMVHSLSRVVLSALLDASKKGKRFKVILTESRPDNLGYKMAERLHKEGIPVTMIVDAAAAHFMGRVDIVIVGAEAIVENGGIINKIGTFHLSIAAKEHRKPFYVAAESFKFTRLFPLNQTDFPQKTFENAIQNPPVDVPILSPVADFTPPNYITLLWTELGVLTPAAVSDELIKLYY